MPKCFQGLHNNRHSRTNMNPQRESANRKLGADTSGCPIECVPDLIHKRAYQLFEKRGCQMERSELSLNIGFSANLYPIWQAVSLLAPQSCVQYTKPVSKHQFAVS